MATNDEFSDMRRAGVNSSIRSGIIFVLVTIFFILAVSWLVKKIDAWSQNVGDKIPQERIGALET